MAASLNTRWRQSARLDFRASIASVTPDFYAAIGLLRDLVVIDSAANLVLLGRDLTIPTDSALRRLDERVVTMAAIIRMEVGGTER
jgi:hypothetical protein